MTARGNSAKRRIHQYLLDNPTFSVDVDKVASQFCVSPWTAEHAIHDLVQMGYVERAKVLRLRRVAEVNKGGSR